MALPSGEPAIFMMLAIVIGALIMVAIASYWGSEWSNMANLYVPLTLVFITLGLALFALVGWLKRH